MAYTLSDILALINTGKLTFNSPVDRPYIDFIYRGVRVSQKPYTPLYQKFNKGVRIDSDYMVDRKIIIHYNISDLDDIGSTCTCPNPETCNCECCKHRREVQANPDFNCNNGADSYSDAYYEEDMKKNEAMEKLRENYDLASQRSEFLTYLMNKDHCSLYVFSSVSALMISDTITFNAPENTYTPVEIYAICINIIDIIFNFIRYIAGNNESDDEYDEVVNKFIHGDND